MTRVGLVILDVPVTGEHFRPSVLPEYMYWNE